MPLKDHIKPDPYRAPTMDLIQRGREMYGQGFTVSRCLAATGMSYGTFYAWLDGGPRDEAGQPALPPIARRRVVVGKRRKPLAASRVSLLARLYRTAERQVFEIEQRLAVPGEATPARERDVRMLASLTRTLRELSGLDGGAPEAEDAAGEAALAQARTQMQTDEELRGAEERLSMLRQVARAMHNVVKVEAMQAERAAALTRKETEKKDEAARADELRLQLARRIEGFAAERQAERERGGKGD